MKRLIGFAVILILVVLVQGCQALQPALDDWNGKNMQMSSGPSAPRSMSDSSIRPPQ